MEVALIAVVTLDGCITRHDQPGAGHWASPEDQTHFRAVASACDVRVFGASTYRGDRDSIRAAIRPGTRRVVLTRNPSAFEADAVPGQLEFSDEPVSELVVRLANEGHQRLALLGGGEIYGTFLAADLVDELQLTVEPLLFGAGVRLAGASPLEARFALESITNLNADTLLLRYRRATTV